MLKTLEVIGPQGSSLMLPLGTIVDGIMIKEIEGLQPVRATISSTQFASVPGEKFQSSRRNARFIVLTLRLEPFFGGRTVYAIRQRLYEFFMPENQVKLKFSLESGLNVEIDGIVEDFDTSLFVQEPEVRIPIFCEDPDFLDPTVKTGFIMSTAGRDTQSYVYDGTIPTGVEFNTQVLSNLTELSIFHQTPSGFMSSMTLQTPMFTNDKIYLNTVVGNKQVLITRGHAARSYIYALTPGSTWITLRPGENTLRFHSNSLFPMRLDIKYKNKYGGL